MLYQNVTPLFILILVPLSQEKKQCNEIEVRTPRSYTNKPLFKLN